MNIKKYIIPLLLLLFCATTMAQNKQQMQTAQTNLAALLLKVANDPTDNERYLASEEAVEVLARALEIEDSHKWKWELPTVASVLTSPDGLFRIFSWAVVRDNGEFECFGAVQYYNDREEEYQYQILHDKSEEIMNREESILTADNWFGAIYQELIQTSADGRTYYTLLGWNGVDNLTDRRIIEPVMFKSGAPQFGAPLFRRQRNQRRIVLEYRGDAAVGMTYDVQTVKIVERERVKSKKSNRYQTIEKTKEHKQRMIIFDEVEPQIEGMEGLYQYYVPSGVELAYVWSDGKWELQQGAQGRLTDKKLNKTFEPLQKDSPSYQFNR